MWLAFASTSLLFGAIWQSAVSVLTQIDAMKEFLGTHNRLVDEQRAQVKAQIKWWRVLKMRQRLKEASKEVNEALTVDEQRLFRRYDQQAWGWSFVTIGALIACVVTWSDLFASLGN